jgi:hypothetical protein
MGERGSSRKAWRIVHLKIVHIRRLLMPSVFSTLIVRRKKIPDKMVDSI